MIHRPRLGLHSARFTQLWTSRRRIATSRLLQLQPEASVLPSDPPAKKSSSLQEKIKAMAARTTSLSQQDAKIIVGQTIKHSTIPEYAQHRFKKYSSQYWTDDWRMWPYFFMFYSSSPYYPGLRLIDMVLRLKYGMLGKIRGLCFTKPDLFVRLHPRSTSEDAEIRDDWTPETQNEAFIFWVEGKLQDPSVYLCDIGTLTVYRLHNSFKDTHALSKRTAFSNLGRRPLVFRPLRTSAEGEELIGRILRRDGSVGEALKERKLLGDIPKETEMASLDNKDLQDGEVVRPLEWYHRRMVERVLQGRNVHITGN